MKKKILIICAVVLLLGILSYGTLAYFHDTDTVTNTFTVGNVKITQTEQQHDENGQLVAFQQDQTLLPVVNVNDPSSDENYVEKIVTVSSTGNNPAYVRTHIAVPTALVDVLTLDLSDSANWVQEAATTTQDVQIDGKTVNVTVFSYTYTQELAKGETTDALLEGVYMNANVDMKEQNGEPKFCTWNGTSFDFYDYDVSQKVYVLVATQGVQSQGFADAASALDAAFPNVPDFNA
ncbi:MAG: SipW-dependent-type signal peptide-containing protein [Oscillospiraceae bacterium]|nr:SipW-dependent-type signal peptide-containing protein [Oscillospiraceae bacterium]